MLSEHQAAYDWIEGELQTKKLFVDATVLASARNALTAGKIALDQLKSEILSIKINSRTALLVQHLREDEAVVANIQANFSGVNDEKMSKQQLDNIRQRRECLSDVLKKVDERIETLKTSDIRMCERHWRNCIRLLDQIRTKAEALQRKLDQIPGKTRSYNLAHAA